MKTNSFGYSNTEYECMKKAGVATGSWYQLEQCWNCEPAVFARRTRRTSSWKTCIGRIAERLTHRIPAGGRTRLLGQTTYNK